MESQKHILVDFLSKDESHLNFNASFLKCLDFEFQLLGIKSHIKKLNPNSEFESFSRNDKGQWILEVISVFFLLLTKKKKKVTVLAFENYFFPTLLLIFLPFFLRTEFHLLIHNNISPLKSTPLKRLPLLICCKIFKIKFLCLTKQGKETMIEMGYKKSFFIPHMNFTHQLNEIGEIPVELNNKTTNISLLGRQAELFVKFILPNLDLTDFPNLTFYIFKNVEVLNKPANVEIINRRLNDSEFKAILKFSDFVVFPDINVGYRPSGILLDAISAHCPIIAPNKGHFSEFNDLQIGEFYESHSIKSLLKKLNDKELKRTHFDKNQFEIAINRTSLNSFQKQLNSFYNS